MERPPFPEVIDSSLIAAFRSCPRKAFLEYIEHWKPKSPSVHLHAGAAYAKALEVARTAYYLGDYHTPVVSTEWLPDSSTRDVVDWVLDKRDPGDSDMAIKAGFQAMLVSYGNFQCPSDSAKSLERMLGAYEYYFTQYPFAGDNAVPITLPSGRRGIEFSFAEPVDIRHPVTNNPLLYVGRMDMICSYANGIFGEDDKTTSQLGASWPKQWDLRSQFTGYCWGASKAGFPLSGFLVRGVSILKSKYETMQAITYRPQWMIDRWYNQLMVDLIRMVNMWESGYWDYNLDHACAEYGGCPFRQICLSEPAKQDTWLHQGFERRRWDPVTRDETLMVEAP